MTVTSTTENSVLMGVSTSEVKSWLSDTTNVALQTVSDKVEKGVDGFLKWGRGVVHGDREKVQAEIVQIAASSKGKERKVLIIESDAITADDHDAYKQFPVKADIEKFREMAKDNELDYCPIKYRSEYVSNLRQRKKDEVFYDDIRVRAHGEWNNVQLGAFTLTKCSTANLTQLAERVKDGGRVIFESCSAGAGEDNLARTFSGLCPQATVYEPIPYSLT